MECYENYEATMGCLFKLFQTLRPVLWEGDIIESAKPSVQVLNHLEPNRLNRLKDAKRPTLRQVNDIKGQASDLMSSLKSSDCDVAKLRCLRCLAFCNPLPNRAMIPSQCLPGKEHDGIMIWYWKILTDFESEMKWNDHYQTRTFDHGTCYTWYCKKESSSLLVRRSLSANVRL